MQENIREIPIYDVEVDEPCQDIHRRMHRANASIGRELRNLVDNSKGVCGDFFVISRDLRIFPPVVKREIGWRNRRRLLIQSPASKTECRRAKQSKAGTAGVGGQRREGQHCKARKRLMKLSRGHPRLRDVENVHAVGNAG